MAAILHLCSRDKKPLLILHLGEKEKQLTLGRSGWGKQTREHCPALLSSLNKGMYNHSITNQGQSKMLPYTESWNL